MKKYNKAGRYSKQSTIAKVKERDERTYGPLKSKRVRWSDKEMSILLEKFLVDHIPTVDLVKNLKRPRDGVETMLRKLAEANESKQKAYKPINRTNRDHLPFTNRDLWVIYIATGETGRREGAHRGAHIACLLGRSEESVRKRMRDILKANPPCNKGLKILEPLAHNETEEDRLAKQVYEVLRLSPPTW